MKFAKILSSLLLGYFLCISSPVANATIDGSRIAIGGIRCGDLLETAKKQFALEYVDGGRYYRHMENSSTPHQWWVGAASGKERNILFGLFEDEKIQTLAIRAEDPWLFRCMISETPGFDKNLVSTPDGVHIGMSMEYVMEIYGTPDEINSVSRSYIYHSEDGKENLKFNVTTNNIVQRITIDCNYLE